MGKFMDQIDNQKFDIICGNDLQLQSSLYEDNRFKHVDIISEQSVTSNFKVANSLLRSCLRPSNISESTVGVLRQLGCPAVATEQLIIASHSTLIQDDFVQDQDCTVNNCEQGLLSVSILEPSVNSYITYKDLANGVVTIDTVTQKISRCFNHIEDEIFVSLLKAQAPSKILYSKKSIDDLIDRLVDNLNEPTTIICSNSLRARFFPIPNLSGFFLTNGLTVYSSEDIDGNDIYMLSNSPLLGEFILQQDITHIVKQEYAMLAYKVRSYEKIGAMITNRFVKGRLVE
jgi:hypothetical protein